MEERERRVEEFDNFRDKEIIYSALAAAEIFVGHSDNINSSSNNLLSLISKAKEHRLNELRQTYHAQTHGWKQS